jgi:hypothetical protein
VQLYGARLLKRNTEDGAAVVIGCALCLGDPRYECWLKHRLSSLGTLIDFVCSSKNINTETNLIRSRLEKMEKLTEKKQNTTRSQTGIEEKAIIEGVK